jgi:hypothetical protein
LVSLRDVASGGKGSTVDKSAAIRLEAIEARPGSCPIGASSAPRSLNLTIVDDDGDVVIDSTKRSIVCYSGEATHVKFGVRFEGPENCAGSVPPAVQVSNGDLFVSASTEDGSFDDVVGIQCKR